MNINMPLPMSRCVNVLLVLLVAIVASSVNAAELPQTTHDGLELVENSDLRAVYVTPGASLDQYQRIAMLDCFVSFKKNWQRDYNRDVIGLQRRISDDDMERMKTKLASEFKRIFTQELETKGGYEIVTHTGEDVLLLRPAIINLDVTAPDTRTAGFTRTYTASPGQMTLYLELYDSVTNSIIARIIDPEGGRGSAFFQITNSVSNLAEADRILRQWADVLRSHLSAVKDDSGN